jgi:hypothetical protein
MFTRVNELASSARTAGEQLPKSIVDEVRRRMNWLDLATKHDVEVQSRIGRKRVSTALNAFLEAQHEHERELLEALRTEIRAELESLASALHDDAFDGETYDDELDLDTDGDELDEEDFDDELDARIMARRTRNTRNEFDYLDADDDEDELDLTVDDPRAQHWLDSENAFGS